MKSKGRWTFRCSRAFAPIGDPDDHLLLISFMYRKFYGLRERPFDLTPNLRYLLLTPKHQEALSNLEYGISTGNGITLIIGEAGTGKTTLLRELLAPHRPRPSVNAARWAYLNNPRLSPYEFFDSVAHAFQLNPDAARSKSRFLRELECNLTRHRDRGFPSVLVVDEAQSLPHDLLEEVRLLANIETQTEKLLRIVLVGQPALGDRLNEAGLLQLKQRVGLRCTLPPLDLRETAVYMAHRLVLAGGDPARCFSRDAVMTVYERSGGIPRTINVIAENALMTGFAADERPISSEIVLEVCRDFDLEAAGDGSPIRGRAAGMPVTHDSTAPQSNCAAGPANVLTAATSASGRWFSFPQLSSRRR
jgi:general secretion pathway protein A